MTNPRLSRLATDLLRDEPLVIEAKSAGDDARAVFAVEQAIAAERRRQRIKRAAIAGVLALAATVCLFVGWRMRTHAPTAGAARAMPSSVASERVAVWGHALSDGVIVLREGCELALEDGGVLAPNDRVVTAATGRMSISLSTGTQVVVGGSSDFAIVEQGHTVAFLLKAGSVRADVAKLHAGERFLVRTLDGEVEVRGTSFQVDVVAPSSCGSGTSTRVVVTEGIVVVRSPLSGTREDSIRKGESWPRDCSAAASAAALESATPSSPTPLASTANTSPSVMATAAVGAPPASSDLAAQNALFAEASAARRRGDTATAIATYERLAARHPTSPLAESAFVERMRLLAASDPRRGAEVARAYLARYPRGFARAEASELASKDR